MVQRLGRSYEAAQAHADTTHSRGKRPDIGNLRQGQNHLDTGASTRSERVQTECTSFETLLLESISDIRLHATSHWQHCKSPTRMIARCGITAFSGIQAPPLQRLLNDKMSKEPSYFLVPATSGLCIQPNDVKSPFSASIFTAEIDGEPKQQWYIEQGKDRTIAFR